MTTQPLSALTMLLSRHTRRRDFISLIGGAAAAWPLSAPAQQAAMPVVGFLSGVQIPVHLVEAFRRGLSEIGYIEGQNVAFEYRTASGEYDRFRTIADDLVRRASGSDFCYRWNRRGARSQIGDLNDASRVLHGRRPCQAGARHEPKPAGRKPHRPGMAGVCAGSETTGTASRAGPERDCDLVTGKSEKSRQ